MKHHFVSSDKLKTLEQYLCSLISGLISMRSLDAYQDKALTLGILPDECEDYARGMMYETRRLIQIYQKMIQLVEERVELDVETVLEQFQEMVRDETHN